MTPRLKNIIIFGVIAIAFVLIYVFFIKKDPEIADLTSSVPEGAVVIPTTSNPNSQIAQDFLNLLLNVKTIKLDVAIFATPAFMSLRDSSIVLTPDGNEGRPNPFAPLGVDNAVAPVTPATFTTPPPAANPGTTPTAVPIMTPPIPMVPPPGIIN